MITVLLILLLLFLLGYLLMQLPQFGQAPKGKRLERIKASPHYAGGAFQNLHHTPALTGEVSYVGLLTRFLFGKSRRSRPASNLPSTKTDLFQLDPERDILVWFGHSSYFMQLDGKKFLVDPVLSGHASPFPFLTKSFGGSDRYSPEDIPPVDVLVITHDHYDHLDHQTMRGLLAKTGRVITGLGTGAHLEKWGFDPALITEMDWDEEMILDEGFRINTTPARHFSGRRLKRNGSAWLSFVLTTPSKRIFLGGDSGYDDHFRRIGEKFGPFDLAILENGQYNENWKHIHMMPEEVVEAARDLRAHVLLPVHWAKFSLALHAWDEPIIRLVKAAGSRGVKLVHPLIGDPLYLDEMSPSPRWWEGRD